jgi:U3 small nucleolar RNA-associated protein 20
MLYVNFSPLWPPVTTVITSYAVDDCKALFWDVFGTILVQSSELAEKSLPPVSKEGPEMPDKMVQCGDLYTYYSALSDWKVDDGRTDHVNFRYLMWRVIERIPEFAERKSKIIVPIFMDFIQREFTAWENSLVDYQSISSTSSSVSNGKKDVLVVDDREVMDTSLHVVKDNEDSASEEENIVSDMPQAQMHNSCKSEDTCEPLRKRNSLKTLKQLLTVFCLFKNPKGLYQHKELQAQYHSLLLHRDSSIQELAMKCIATFKQPEITPYIDNLINLLDDTEFNTELLKFSSSSEQYIVLMDHTPSLIPVLVRILYGRMLKHGQTKAAVRRRGIVLRFLETCRLSELQEFIGLVLAPFLKTPVLESPDPQCVVPLRKQQGFLKLCGQMIVALKEDIVPFAIDLLNISLRLTKHASIFLDMRKQIATQYVSLLRNIRQLGIQVVTQMFEVFVDFPFSNFEDSIFESIVWPQLGKLPNESIQNPTPLLKLIHQWSMHSRYHQYFLKCLPESSLPILHYVYSCLFSKQVSFSVTDMVFQVTVNLLQEMNREDCSGYQAVSPHLGSILQYISQKWSVPSPKKKVLLTDTELKVLSMISPLVTDTTTAVKFVDVILNFVSHGSSHCKGETPEVNMLKTVKNLAAHIASPEGYLRILSRLFFTVSSRHSRQMLCDILQEMTKGLPHLESVADTVTDLNSWNTAHVDEPDYMIRIEAFGKCPSHLGCVQNFEEVVLLLVNNAMFFLLTASDLSIRDSAAGFISRLIDHDRVNSEEKCADFTIQALFHGILQGLRSHNDTSYNEVIAVLGQLVKSHKGHPKLKEMVILSDPDPEADFFENVRHIQVHRRTRAFLKLESLIVKEQFRVSTLTDIFLPMASHVVASSAMQKEHNLLSAVIDVLGAVASLVKWSTYKYVLMKYLKLLAKKPAREKTLMKVVVAILNAFHFGCTVDESTLPADGSEVMMSDHEECSEDVMERDVEEQNSIPQNIRDSIVHTILPELKAKLLVRDEHSHLEILRSPLVLAMTKLLQSLPKAALHSHLPGILLKICSQLKNRDRDTRDMARNALVKIAQSLGPCYVPYIVKEMKESLTKGYQVHILGFSIYALLTGLSQHLNSGDLDPCSVDVREILVNDLFGAPEEERDTPEAIKKLPEAKTSKSYDCFELLVSKLSPKEVPDIIESLLKILKDQPTAKVSKQVSEVLRRVSLGILGNAGFPVEQVLLLVHGLLVDSVPGMSRKFLEENAKNDLHQSQETILLPPEPRRGGPKPVTQLNITAHVVAHFGLQLTVATLKKHKLQSPNHLQMIDPFIEILSTTIKSKHTNIISVTLKCLRELLPYPLPAMETGLPGFIEELFSILGKYSKHGAAIGPNQELVATAFRAMTDIISISHEVTISEAQLQLLLTFIEEDIHDPQRQSTAFPLLKAIIARKLVVPEIHDVMGRIIQLSVVSDSETTRSQCRLVTCHFLLDYPLGKRIYKYLGAILSNLSYEVQSGRESVLELCNFFFTKFPPRLLHKQATFFFIPLSSQLVNDSSPVCKEMVAVAMKKLLERLDGSKRSELADFLLHWLNSKNLLHQQVAVQALGLFIEVEAENFQKRLTPFLPLLFQCLDSPSDDHDEINSGGVVNMDDSSVDRNHISSDGVAAEVPEETSTMVALRSSTVLENPLLHDHLLFITLSCFGKILIKCSSVLKDPSYADTLNKLWNRAEEFLFYPHTWVKLCACKLFGLLFAVYPPANVATSSHDIVCEYLTSDPRSKATILFNKFYKILKVQSLNPEISDQVVKNMVFCTRVIYHHQLDDKASLDASNDLVKKQIMKMEKLARLEAGNCPKDSSKRSCVLKWIGALAVNFDPKIVEVYLSLLLKPVYRELANEQTIGGDCHKLAEEVAEVIAKILGRDTMAVANASVQKEFSLSKERRKRKIAMDAVVNPEIAARRKIRKNIRKKVQRKIKGRISRLCK